MLLTYVKGSWPKLWLQKVQKTGEAEQPIRWRRILTELGSLTGGFRATKVSLSCPLVQVILQLLLPA